MGRISYSSITIMVAVLLLGIAAGYMLGSIHGRPGGAQPEAATATVTTTVTAAAGSGAGPPSTTTAGGRANTSLAVSWTGYGYRVPWSVVEELARLRPQSPVMPLGGASPAGPATREVGAAPEYSSTNVQVAGVDEPDIVKTNGTHIAVAAGSAAEVYNVYPPEALRLVSVFNASREVEELVGDEELALISHGRVEPVARVVHRVWVRGLFMENGQLVVVAEEARSPWLLPSRTWVIKLGPGMKPLWARAVTGSFYDARLYNDTLLLITYTGFLVRPLLLGAGSGPTPVPEPPLIVGPEPLETIVAAFSLRTGRVSTLTLIGAHPSAMYMPRGGRLYVVLPGVEELHRILGDRGNVTPGELAADLRRLWGSPSRWSRSLLVELAVEPGPRLSVRAVARLPGVVRKQWMLDEYRGVLRAVVEEQGFEEGRWVTRVSLYLFNSTNLRAIANTSIVVGERGARYPLPRAPALPRNVPED